MRKEDLKLLEGIVKMAEGQDPISLNDIMNEMSIGYHRANCLLNELEDLGIVTLNPRKMIVSYSKAMKILNKVGEEMSHFENVIGYKSVKLELERIIDCINDSKRYEDLGVKIPKNLLLFGVPGVGKTLLAKSFINSLNRNKYILRKTKGDGDFVEEIKKVVEEAINNAPSVVLFDDVDKYSNNDEDHTNSDEYAVIQSLIDEAADKDVYFVATANHIRFIPRSLLRSGRFSNKIEIQNPTLKDAKLIIKHYLSDKIVSDDVNCEEIAKLMDGETCALLENVVNEAGLIAGFNHNAVISMNDMIKAILRVVYDSPENLDDKPRERQLTAAYHEAGHAIVSEMLENCSVNLVSIANYFGSIGGITSRTKDENYWADITKMENQVTILLAGKAAVEFMEQKIDVGCSSDLDRASRILNRFYDDYGANRFKYSYEDSSNEAKREKEIWINNKMNEYYSKAMKILVENKLNLVEVAGLLLEKKVLRGKDIRNLLYLTRENAPIEE